jgi:hypothetical protein
MFKPLHVGLIMLGRLKTLIFLIFMWQAFWSWMYFKIGADVVSMMMQRFPNESFTPMSRHLFTFQSEFLFMNTSMAMPTLSIILTLLAIRYIVSPIIQSGLYYTLREEGERSLHLFFKGIRQWCFTFYITNGIKWLLMAFPLLWLLDDWISQWQKAYRIEMFIQESSSSLIWYLFYVFVISMWVMWVQIVIVQHPNVPLVSCFARGLWFMVRNLFKILLIFILLLFILFFISAAFEGIAYFLTGWILLAVQQLSIFWRTFGKVWYVSTWNQYYKSKKPLVI